MSVLLVSRCTLRRPRTTQFLAAFGATILESTTTIETKSEPFRRRLFSTTPNNQEEKKKKKSKVQKRDMDRGLRIAVAGCGHGTLDALYASAQASCEARQWEDLDLFIIGGDFQAVRNAADLSVMSVPAKYRELGDFPDYYSGKKKAPFLTVFVGGNHEASAHLWELYYGGWVAPNIYYMGAANVLRLGPLRIAGMGGIYNERHYDKTHYERLPFGRSEISSFYHTREFDVRKLLLLQEQVDVALSHDWPKTIENHGNTTSLFKWKPDFKKESLDGSLGNPAAEYVMDRLRPKYWFSAHMHCKYPAVKIYKNQTKAELAKIEKAQQKNEAAEAISKEVVANPDEIDLDMDDDEADHSPAKPTDITIAPEPESATPVDAISEEVRAQLPASFAKPVQRPPGVNPGQPVPPTIKNKTVRFLALDKCLPGRKFLQLCEVTPVGKSYKKPPPGPYVLEYDPEWLAVTRALAPYLVIGGQYLAQAPPDLGEEVYRPMIDQERAWVEQNIVRKKKLVVPQNFAITAPPHRRGTDPEEVNYQPDEYTHPQTTAFCELLGVPNLWDASPEERAQLKATGANVTSGGPRFTRGGGRNHSQGFTPRERFVKGGRGWGKSVDTAVEEPNWFPK
ncbi:lariat debranching enzyme, C-terminal domain-containing protein [Annulohypoxylon bovei var. microspora]|nr:lariat debranching enzyme, C-terminal domain-containing protein [Annulohypoxylon bovei var. microspora]